MKNKIEEEERDFKLTKKQYERIARIVYLYGSHILPTIVNVLYLNLKEDRFDHFLRALEDYYVSRVILRAVKKQKKTSHNACENRLF